MSKIDLTGKRFGKLTAIKRSNERLRNEFAWICKCDCGNETLATQGQLLSGRKKSCGCLKKKSPKNFIDLTGKRFGILTVIERHGTTKNNTASWLCMCDCGNTTITNGTSLRRGDTVSCGCLIKDQNVKARKVLTEDKSIDGVQVPLLKRKVRSDSQSGHKGIYKRNRNGRITYEPHITIKGKRKYLGVFKNLDDAIAARKLAEKEYHDPYIKALEEKENEDR